VALGFPLLLHLERAAAVVGVLGGVAVVAYLTSRGYLPSQLGNIGYPVVGRQHELERRVAELGQGIEGRLGPLEEGRQASDEALALISSDLQQLDGRLEALERKTG